jgi:hypothetical protein
MPAEGRRYLVIQWNAHTAIIRIKNPDPDSALAQYRTGLAWKGYNDKQLPEGPAGVAKALGVSPPGLDSTNRDIILNLDGQPVIAELPIALIEQAIAVAKTSVISEQPAEPHYRALHVFLAQPALLFARAPENHVRPPDAVVLAELWRAVEAGEIRHEVDMGGAYVPPLAGLSNNQITGALWHSDAVNRMTGCLDHPLGVPRPIKICLEDAQAHIHAWSQKRSSTTGETAQDPQVDEPPAEPGLPIELTPTPKQAAGKKSSYLTAFDNEQVRVILTAHGILVGAPDAPVPVTADQANNFWRWSKENAHQAAGGGSIDTKTKRLRDAFTRCTKIVPDAEVAPGTPQ